MTTTSWFTAMAQRTARATGSSFELKIHECRAIADGYTGNGILPSVLPLGYSPDRSVGRATGPTSNAE